MAEVLGVIAGGAGLASLAIQLGETSIKLKHIYRSYQEAPKLLGDISAEIETFVLILHSLEKDRQQNGTIDRAIVDRCVLGFAQAVNQVASAIGKFKLARQKSDVKGRVIMALGQTHLLQLRDELERAKASLALAFQLYSWSCRKDNQILEQLNNVTSQIMEQNQKYGNAESLQQAIMHLAESQNTREGMPDPSLARRSHRLEQRSGRAIFEVVPQLSRSTHHRGSRQRFRQHWRMKVSLWFTARVWEISINIAQSGFNLNLRTCNFVPGNALIFEACRGGDIAEVQALFHSGEASPFDCSSSVHDWTSGETVLSAAAKSGNLQLCRYLIKIVGFPVSPTHAEDPLDAYATSGHTVEAPAADAIQMYRLLSMQPGWDIDNLISKRKGCPWWWHCDDVACVRLIRDEFSLTFSQLSWEVQVKIAINNSGHRKTHMPRIFLEMLGHNKVNSHIAQAQDGDGLTALHMIARQLVWTHVHYVLDTWVDFIRELLAFGAEIHQRTSQGDTPFTYLLRCVSGMFGRPSTALKIWVQMLQKAGINLQLYGWREQKAWNTLYPSGTESHDYKIRSWTYGPSVEDWTVDCVRKFVIPVYKLVSAPGAWSDDDEFKCNTICWIPWGEEIPDGYWKWLPIQEIVSYQKYDPSMRYQRDDLYDILSQELDNTQDDCGAVMRLIQTSSRACHSTRRYSLPTAKKTRRGINARRNWLRRCHICLEDDRLKFPEERRCVDRIDLEWWSDQPDYHECIRRQMRRFQTRYRSPDELRSLPYAAYHLNWRRDWSAAEIEDL